MTIQGIFQAGYQHLVAQGMLPSQVTVYTKILVRNTIGEKVLGSPATTVILHQGACAIGIQGLTSDRMSGNEKRGPDLTQVSNRRVIALAEQVPTIGQTHRQQSSPQVFAMVDGEEWLVVNVVDDSQGAFTELHVEAVKR